MDTTRFFAGGNGDTDLCSICKDHNASYCPAAIMTFLILAGLIILLLTGMPIFAGLGLTSLIVMLLT